MRANRVVVAAVAVATVLVTGVTPAQAGGRDLTLRRAAPHDLRIGSAVAGGGHHLE